MFTEYSEYLELLPKKLLMFGGGSSSGQGGPVDYPSYMKMWHNTIIQITNSEAVSAMSSPPTTYMYDPKVWFGIPADADSCAYQALEAFQSINVPTLFKDLLSDTSPARFVLSEQSVADIKAKAVILRNLLVDPTGADAAVEAMVDAHSTKLLQKINTDVMPKVEVGMRDLNAVIGTSFVIARELVMEDYMHEVSDFSAKSRVRMWELRHELYKFVESSWLQGAVHAAEVALKRIGMQVEVAKFHVTATTEVANMATLAQSKYGVVQTEAQTRTRMWRLEVWNHMNAALASISGAHTITSPHSQGSGVLGGVIGGGSAGAAAGTAILPGIGTLIGGIGGAILGGIGGAKR
jgi:hypothetical protein